MDPPRRFAARNIRRHRISNGTVNQVALFLLLHLPLLPLLLLPLLLLFFFYDVVVSVALWRLLRGIVSFFFIYRVLPSFTEFFFP